MVCASTLVMMMVLLFFVNVGVGVRICFRCVQVGAVTFGAC